MRRTIKLNKRELKGVISESVKRILNEQYEPNSLYIVFDGTTYYEVYGFDIEDEIAENDVEVVEGPFDESDEEVEYRVEELNNEAMYGVNWRKQMSMYESRRRRLNEMGAKSYDLLRQRYEEYQQSIKNLCAVLRSEVLNGDKEAAAALHEFVSSKKTYKIEDILCIR